MIVSSQTARRYTGDPHGVPHRPTAKHSPTRASQRRRHASTRAYELDCHAPPRIGARSTPARAVSPPRGPWTPPRVLSILPANWPTSSVVGRCCYATPTGPQANGATEPLHTLLNRLAVQRAPRRGATLPALRANGARLSAAPLQHGESRAVTGAALLPTGAWSTDRPLHHAVTAGACARWRTARGAAEKTTSALLWPHE